MAQWIAYPITQLLGDNAPITGYRITQVTDTTAAEHLANPRLRCRAATAQEISDEQARITAGAAAAAAALAARQDEVQARADMEKTHV